MRRKRRPDPALATRLYDQAAAVVRDEPAALKGAVRLLDKALQVAPREQDMHGRVAIALAEAVGQLYRLTGDDALLSSWGQRATEWLKIVPADDWRMPLYVLAFGVLLFHRAKSTGDEEDVRAAIETLETARSSVSRNSGIHSTSSAYLADLRLSNYWDTLQPAELESAVHDAWNVVQGKRTNPRERYLGLVTLANALIVRYRLGGEASDALAAVEYADDALEIATTDDERTRAHGVRTIAFRLRFGLTDELEDIDEAMRSCQHLIDHVRDQPEARAQTLDNNGNLLFDRYRLTGQPVDLMAAVEASRAALAMLPADSPSRVHVLGNLGATLAEASRDRRDLGLLDEAVGASRAAVAHADRDAAEAPQLWAQLASTLTQRALAREPDVGLLDEALDAFDRAAALLEEPGSVPVDYALGRQRVWWALPDRHVAALLHRARLATRPEDAPLAYLRRAFEVGEAAKSRLLSESVARTALHPPPEVPPGLANAEQYMLSHLDHVDAVELAAVGTTPTAERLELLKHRQAVRRQLEMIWAEMAATSEAAAEYVAGRRGATGWMLTALDAGDPDTAYLTILRFSDIARLWLHHDHEGLAVLALRPGRDEPLLAEAEPDDDPVPEALVRFTAEVPVDAGLGLREETWHEPLVSLLRPVIASLGPVTSYVISPPAHGRGLPWHLVLERCGWPSEDASGSVVTVPTLAIAASAGDVSAWGRVHFIRDNDVERATDRGMALILKAAGNAPAQPLVVGDPTGDLDNASDEARLVAQTLDVEPLLGAAATVEAVRRALEVAPVVHLAAHARFEPDSPLDSQILLADGFVPARALIDTPNRAELVVLSACESGTGGSLAGAEVAGLAHALLRAGTRTVIASLWPVDDASTAFLMSAFYRSRSAGLSDSSALAAAMRQTRDRPGWEPPYFWSGFVALTRGGV